MDHVDIASATDPDLFECGVGAIVHLKGKLEGVRYDDRPGAGRSKESGDYTWSTVRGPPNICVTFADWSMLAAEIDGYDHAEALAKAKAITIPLSTYVCVKAQVINEDVELRALAIWPLDSCVPIPLGEPIHV